MANGQLDAAARIIVVGVGGGGSNAVNRMIQAGIRGIEFVAVNTDAQALARSEAPVRLRIGEKLTRGLGAGGQPSVGARAAEESQDEIASLFQDADLVFIAAGMGGGTGTGASPVIASIAQEAGALTIGVVTKPFHFEGSKRAASADEGINSLKTKVNTLITIPNERLLQVIDKKTSLQLAFTHVDDVLRQGIQGISELITEPGLVNLDFADVKTIMQEAGSALMAIGRGTGENRAADAAKMAIASPLLEISMEGARGVLFNVSGGADLTLAEIQDAADVVTKAADPDANIIFGAVIDPDLQGEVKVTVIATGFDQPPSGQSAFGLQATRRASPDSAPRPLREPRDLHEAREPRDPRETRDYREFRDPRDYREAREGRGSEYTPPSYESSFDDDEDLDVPAFIRRRQPPRRP
ncbi:MAG: cell division protein FtsZ [Chloroflexi bacterium]|nr:cell division protein FtsZ [Chloroflexota bacterium]